MMDSGFSHGGQSLSGTFDLSLNWRRRPQWSPDEIDTQILHKLKYSRSEMVAIALCEKIFGSS